jgi:hypothetical protein
MGSSVFILQGQDEILIWQEFVKALKNNEITEDFLRPHQYISKKSLLQTLNTFRLRADWEEWEVEPEVVRYAHVVSFLIPLKQRQEKGQTYNFTFILEEGRWFLQHIEGIFIRLDKISDLPTSEFPDIDEESKTWIRHEIYWSKMVWLYNRLSRTEGKESALGIFLDGAGYFLAAKTWVPFVPTERAFILYLCWEQSQLRGNSVSLEKLEENEALVKLDPIFFRLYRHTGHLKNQILFKEYRSIFEAIWQDRAKNAGWKLEIEYRGIFSFLHFTK